MSFPTQVAAFVRASGATSTGIRNVATQLDTVGHVENRVPVTINSDERDNSWVCSPYTAYCRYTVEELQRFGGRVLTAPLTALCHGLGAYLRRARIDQAVAINNWVLSTNLYPRLDPFALREWIEEAKQRWPNHAIWFRSLNPRYTGEWLKALRATGCRLIPSRQVYLYDRIRPDASEPKNLVLDLRLTGSTPLVACDAATWSSLDFERAADLYAQLYLQKYSRLNPEYSARFLAAWHENGLLELTGYRDDRGVLQAIVGLFVVEQTITAPIVGYELGELQRWSLYRLLMATVYHAAARTGHRVNLSAGAAEFKRLRGGVGTMEYSAVYAGHLPKGRQRALDVLTTLATRIGAPIMRHFEL